MACSRPAAGLAILYACAGRRGDARATLGAVKALAQKEFVSLYGIASYYAVNGDNDCALDWLNKAYSERDGTLVWLKVHPRLDGLRASGLGDGMICRYLDGNANQSGRLRRGARLVGRIAHRPLGYQRTCLWLCC
jgi:hypothetical protein